MRLFLKNIMYEKDGWLMCKFLYDRLPEEEKSEWIACVPDYDKMERDFKKIIASSNLEAVEITIP